MNYYNEIKKELINNEIYKKVKDYSKNRNDLNTYYNVGKLIIEAQGGEERAKYGDNLIKEYSKKLTKDFNYRFNSRILWRSRKFYLLFSKEKMSTMSTQLSWSHYVELLNIDDHNKINYYIDISQKNNLSVRELRTKIKNKEYERLDDKTKEKISKKEKITIEDFIKKPIIINNKLNINEITEKVLSRLIMEDLTNFLNELGQGFCFIGNEYKIKLGNNYNYLDLLLFNIVYNCYVVIELKITELKSEYIGQISKYMNYIDKHIKNIEHNKTIGIIICKKDNKFVIEYSSNPNIFRTIYKIR